MQDKNSALSKKIISAFAGLLLVFSTAAWSKSTEISKPAPHKEKLIELTFVLDTTGSMGGLIDGAKAKIWSIVNSVMQNQDKNASTTVRVGLVAYRDRGDDYVTRVTPLTDNLDAVYKTLMNYRAMGGGDTPEDVRTAMRDAVAEAGWSNAGKNVSQIIFLVGDAPPHDDYQDVPSTQDSTRKAKNQGIIVNTIQVGSIQGTESIWRSIAQYGGGEYFAIAQDGGVKMITTPYDKELSSLGSKIGSTYLSYGNRNLRISKARAQMEIESSISVAAPTIAQADRAINKAINEKAYDTSDLVQAIETGTIKLESIPKEELPDLMQAMSPEERKNYVYQQITERKIIRARIMELSSQRDAYIAEKMAKDGADGFDITVKKALEKQIR